MTVGRNRRAEQGIGKKDGSREPQGVPAAWRTDIGKGTEREAIGPTGRTIVPIIMVPPAAMVLIIITHGQEAVTTMVRGKILQLQRPVLLRLWQKRRRTV